MTAGRRVIVAGAGCAGLAVATALDRALPDNWEIAIVDEHFDLTHSKTWCFWGPRPDALAPFVSYTWDRARFRSPGWERTDALGHNRYHRVDEGAYRAFHLDRLRHSQRVRWVTGSVRDISNLSQQRACVRTDSETLVGRWVFQSIVRPTPVVPARTALLQHFGGWEVETDAPIFDPGVFTLMDFSVEQRGAVAFRYVLPTAPNRALVEHTVFSSERLPTTAYDDALRAFFVEKGCSYRIVRTEYGGIPMRDDVLPQQSGPCVFNLGTVGGMTKPTTGYTFLRIQQQVESLVGGLVQHGAPTPLRERPKRFAWYDGLLLQILAGSPHLGRTIFTRLFQGQSTEAILTFLDERSTPLEEAKLFWSLPWSPFLRAAASHGTPPPLALQAAKTA